MCVCYSRRKIIIFDKTYTIYIVLKGTCFRQNSLFNPPIKCLFLFVMNRFSEHFNLIQIVGKNVRVPRSCWMIPLWLIECNWCSYSTISYYRKTVRTIFDDKLGTTLTTHLFLHSGNLTLLAYEYRVTRNAALSLRHHCFFPFIHNLQVLISDASTLPQAQANWWID